jgi:hypothetical protein
MVEQAEIMLRDLGHERPSAHRVTCFHLAHGRREHDMTERDMKGHGMKGHDNLCLRHKRYRLIFSPPLLPVASVPPLKESILPGPRLSLLLNNQHYIYLSNRIFRFDRAKWLPPWINTELGSNRVLMINVAPRSTLQDFASCRLEGIQRCAHPRLRSIGATML